jgi:hypothetical protein
VPLGYAVGQAEEWNGSDRLHQHDPVKHEIPQSEDAAKFIGRRR